MLSRRRFLRAMTMTALAAPFAAEAQQDRKVRRIGYLDQGSASANQPYLEALRQGLRDLGWIEGQNLAVEARFAEGKTDQLPALAADLVRSRMDVIVTWSTPAALAAKRATTSVPIVIGFAADPVLSGIVSSLARPGGNITGWTHLGLELRAKYLELLKEAVPHAARVGVLWNPANQVHQPSLKVIEAAAQRLRVELHLAGVSQATGLDGAFTGMVAKRVEAIVVFPDGMFVAQRAAILSLAARHRLPAMYGVLEYVESGGLMAYGANLPDMHRRVSAAFVDKILRGANPADLPVVQPTVYELAINLRTAAALGLTIPQSVLLRADHVVQ
jgi:ABC-type uncharacterized transport system substrate-binding protein